MTYRLHNRLGSGGFAIEATLSLAGVPFDYEPMASRPNQPLGPKIAHLNSWGQVPVLDLPDGGRMTEVAAMLAQLSVTEAGCREGPYLWIDDHPAFLRWSVFLAVNVYEGILRQSYTPRFFQPLPVEEDGAESLQGFTASGLNASMDRNLKNAAKTRVHQAFRCLENDTAEHAFLLGPRLSSCDIFLAMLYAWHGQQPDLPKCTRITQLVATHDQIRPIWRRNFHDRLDHKWHEA